MSFLASWIPPHPGLLPKWLLLVSGISILNALSSFANPAAARRVYAYPDPAVSDLAGRLFGTWTLLSGVIRLYGAYYVTDPVVYTLTLWTFVIALVHFGAETLVWRTTGPKTAAAATYVVATVSTLWMFLAREEYVG